MLFRSNKLMQLGTLDGRANEHRLAMRVHTMHSENVLGEIDPDVQNGHGLPLPSELMRDRTSHRGTQLPFAAMRPIRDGEVPSIR